MSNLSKLPADPFLTNEELKGKVAQLQTQMPNAITLLQSLFAFAFSPHSPKFPKVRNYLLPPNGFTELGDYYSNAIIHNLFVSLNDWNEILNRLEAEQLIIRMKDQNKILVSNVLAAQAYGCLGDDFFEDEFEEE